MKFLGLFVLLFLFDWFLEGSDSSSIWNCFDKRLVYSCVNIHGVVYEAGCSQSPTPNSTPGCDTSKPQLQESGPLEVPAGRFLLWICRIGVGQGERTPPLLNLCHTAGFRTQESVNKPTFFSSRGFLITNYSSGQSFRLFHQDPLKKGDGMAFPFRLGNCLFNFLMANFSLRKYG